MSLNYKAPSKPATNFYTNNLPNSQKFQKPSMHNNSKLLGPADKAGERPYSSSPTRKVDRKTFSDTIGQL